MRLFWSTGAAFAALIVMGTLIGSPSLRADDAGANGVQDEKQMIRTGLVIAPVPLNMAHKDQVNAATCPGGGSDFGVFPSPNGTVHIISAI